MSEISRRRTSSAAPKAMMTRILDYPSPLPMQRARCPVRLRLSSSCPALMNVSTRLPQASARAHAQRTHPLDYLLTATRRRSRGPSIVASAFTLCLWSRHCQSQCRTPRRPCPYVLPRHRRPCTTTRKGCSPLLGECIENGRSARGPPTYLGENLLLCYGLLLTPPVQSSRSSCREGARFSRRISRFATSSAC